MLCGYCCIYGKTVEVNLGVYGNTMVTYIEINK